MVEISVSLLNIERENSVKTMYDLEVAKVDYFHIDVMDGKFVETDTSFVMGEYCEYLDTITNLPLDVHLMCEDVESYISSYLIYHPNIITFHVEATKDKDEMMKHINFIKENHCKVGISIKPNTKVEEIYPYLPYVHQVLIMTVEPGKGGQGLIPETIEKIRKLKEYIKQNNLDIDIEADGGITIDNIKELSDAGVDIAVVGTQIVKEEDYTKIVKKLKETAKI